MAPRKIYLIATSSIILLVGFSLFVLNGNHFSTLNSKYIEKATLKNVNSSHVMRTAATTNQAKKLHLDFKPEIIKVSKSAPEFCRVHDFRSVQHDDHNIQCVVTVTSPVVQICVHPPETDGFVSGSILRKGSWELDRTEQIMAELRSHPKAGFVDIGANIGMHSLVAAKSGTPVVAVEPLTMNIIRLHKSVLLNELKNYILVNNAISDTRATVNIEIKPKNVGGSSIVDVLQGNGGDIERVFTILMDDLLEVVSFEEAVMKIDIEGSEAKAFAHAEQLFRRVKVHCVFMEWGHMKRMMETRQHKTSINNMVYFFLMHKFVPCNLITRDVLCLTDMKYWPKDIIWINKS